MEILEKTISIITTVLTILVFYKSILTIIGVLCKKKKFIKVKKERFEMVLASIFFLSQTFLLELKYHLSYNKRKSNKKSRNTQKSSCKFCFS